METATNEARLPLGNVAILTLCSVLQMVFQFGLLTLIARWFGTSVEVDAFNAALAVPLAIAAVMAGPLPLVLVPEMVRMLGSGGNVAQGWRLGSAVLVGFAGLGTLVALLISVEAHEVAGWLFSGFSGDELELAAAYTSRLCWLVPLNGCITLLQAVHHARQKFRLAAVSNLFGVATPLLWVLTLSRPTLMDIADGTVAGAVVAVAVLLLPLGRSLAVGWLATDRRSVGLWRFAVLVTPLLLAGIYARVDPLVDRVIASHLDPGSIAELAYAQRLIVAMSTLVSSGLSVAIFPQLAAHAHERTDQHARLLAMSWRFLIFLIVPAVVAVLLFGRAMVADLFQRGEFGVDATRNVAFLWSVLMGTLVGGSLGEIATKSLYARGHTRGPAVVAVFGFTVGVFLKIALSRSWGIAGVAAGTTIYYLMNVSIFLWMIYRSVGRSAFLGARVALGKAVMASGAAAAAGAVPVLLLNQGGAIVGGCVGLVVYAAAQMALNNEFVPLRALWSVRRGKGH